MALISWFWRRPAVARDLVGEVTGASQGILIASEVASHVERHVQRSSRASEAGGQLFGLVEPDCVRVIQATGPYRNDERTRFGYRSCPEAAQRSIVIQAKAGLLYLGEWHTHAEDVPSPSADDIAAVETLRQRSRLNTNSMLLLVVGRAAPPFGWDLRSFGEHGVLQWHLSEAQSGSRCRY